MDTNYNKISLPRDFIYEFTLDKNLVTNYLDTVLSSDMKFMSSYSEENTTYAYPIPFDSYIIDEITKCVNEVSSLYIDTKLKICDIWITKTGMLQVSKPHDHCLSIFSGVLYLNDSDTETIFTVPDQFMMHNQSFLSVISKQHFSNSIRTKPELGKLLIWPSYVKHKISTHKSKNVRYSLAFNSFFDGVISTTDTQRLSLQTKDPEYLERNI